MLTNVSLGLEVLGYSAGGWVGPLVLLLYLQFDCFTRKYLGLIQVGQCFGTEVMNSDQKETLPSRVAMDCSNSGRFSLMMASIGHHY